MFNQKNEKEMLKNLLNERKGIDRVYIIFSIIVLGTLNVCAWGFWMFLYLKAYINKYFGKVAFYFNRHGEMAFEFTFVVLFLIISIVLSLYITIKLITSKDKVV